MAKKIVIELFRKKDPEELTAAFADPDAKPNLASSAALTAANACAMGLRAAKMLPEEGERIDYLRRNLDKQRSYMIYLIDEDLKGRGIMARAQKEGDPAKIDAARHSVCAISDEIINQMCHVTEYRSSRHL